jgi:hypothetical protein
MTKKKDSYEEHACEFENEAECEEDLDEDGEEVVDVEKKHFEEDEDSFE